MSVLHVSGLMALAANLDAVGQDDDVSLDFSLIEQILFQLDASNIPHTRALPVPKLVVVLHRSMQDLSSLYQMTQILLDAFDFPQCLNYIDGPLLCRALVSPYPDGHLLALNIIGKAARRPQDTAVLSTYREVVFLALNLWLITPLIAVSEVAATVLLELLNTDYWPVEGSHPPEGTNGSVRGERGRLCRYLLQEYDCSSVIRDRCVRSPRAQSRLLRFLPQLAMVDITLISQTYFPQLFPLPPNVETVVGSGGLLQWAVLVMADKTDRFMYLTRTDFFRSFLPHMREFAITPDERWIFKRLIQAAVIDDEGLEMYIRNFPDSTGMSDAAAMQGYILGLFDADTPPPR